jgi:hypothetical protein
LTKEKYSEYMKTCMEKMNNPFENGKHENAVHRRENWKIS